MSSFRTIKKKIFQNKKINVTGSGTDLGKSYIMFIRSNLDTLSKRITDDCWILIVTERYYRHDGC